MNRFNIDVSDLYHSVKHLQENGLVFQYNDELEYDGRTITVNNKKLLHLANCSYLGLEKHAALIDGAIEAVKKHGTQNSMSRAMLSSHLYKELESYLSQIFPGYQIVFPTSTLAHCSTLPLLIKENDAIILDAYVHNSVRMASQLCRANGTFSIISKHNDMAHIKYLIKRLKKDGYKNIWYCADGIYSMHGNLCDVEGLHKLLDEEENFYAYVDDAHGIGCYGKNGCGYVIGNFGLHEKMIVVGSFAKSIAVNGGIIIVPDKILADYIRLTGQTSIFSGPIQPASLGALIASMKFHLSDELPKYQNELSELIHYFRNKCEEYELPIVTKDITPIQLIRIGSTENVLKIQRRLIDKGFFPTAAVYPAVSEGDGGIRISITRHIKKTDMDKLLVNMKEILETENLHVKEDKLVNIQDN